MDMTLAQRAVAFVAIIFLFLLACFALAAYDKMARPELHLTKLIGEYSERTINSPGGSGQDLVRRPMIIFVMNHNAPNDQGLLR
jgi:hypothetical protein